MRRVWSDKKEKGKLDIEAHPRLQYTAFACVRLGTDVSIYPERWMNESGYRAIEEQMRAHAVRIRPYGYFALQLQLFYTT